MTPDDENPYTTSDLADKLQVKRRTVAEWANNGWIPGAYRTPGGYHRFHRTTVDQWLANGGGIHEPHQDEGG